MIHSLSITTDERTNYEFTVDGTVHSGPFSDTDEASDTDEIGISGCSAEGFLLDDDEHEFRYTGTITDFRSEEPVETQIDGRSTDSASFPAKRTGER